MLCRQPSGKIADSSSAPENFKLATCGYYEELSRFLKQQKLKSREKDVNKSKKSMLKHWHTSNLWHPILSSPLSVACSHSQPPVLDESVKHLHPFAVLQCICFISYWSINQNIGKCHHEHGWKFLSRETSVHPILHKFFFWSDLPDVCRSCIRWTGHIWRSIICLCILGTQAYYWVMISQCCLRGDWFYF
jgi:hypothetical protein